MEDQSPRAPASLARYASLAVWVGLLLGLLEAAYLFRYTRPPGMLKPNVAWVVWFLGPLLDGLSGGFVGLALGLLIVNSRANQAWERIAKFGRGHWVGVALAGPLIIGTWVAFALISRGYALRTLKVTAVLVLLLVVYKLGRSVRLKTLALTLSIPVLTLLTGVGIYCLRPSLVTRVAAGERQTGSDKPNIILITLDTVRADHLSSYGYARRTTPNIDHWAEGGVIFENAIATTSWTLGSHASIFTGVLPHQHGADWQIPLNTSRWTLAEALKAQGYETAGFSSNIGYGEAGWGLDRGFDLFEDNRWPVLHNLEALKIGHEFLGPLYRRWVWPEYFERRRAFQLNQHILDWFRQRSPQPYFLFINYFDVHDPYRALGTYARRFGSAPPALFRKTKFAFTTSGTVHLPDPDRIALINGYDNSLAFLDHCVGDLLDALSHSPQWENTVVIITSDHGEGFGEHGTYCHGVNLYRESVHVPLVIFGRGVPRARRISTVVSIQNLFSTALQFAEGGNGSIAHTSLQRYWTSGASSGELDESIISELTPKYGFTGLWPQVSLRTQDWEFIRDSRGTEQLYRWRQDPGEQHNLAGDPAHRTIVETLDARLRTLIGDSRRPWLRPQYLSALDQPRHPFVNAAAEMPAPERSSGIRLEQIGDVQDAFPPHQVVSSRVLDAPDRDLLESLPYH